LGSTSTAIRRRPGTADSLGVEPERVDAATSDAVEAAFAAIPQKQVEGLFAAEDPIFYEIADRVARLALELRLPGIFQSRRCVDVGALMSFGVDLDDLDRRATTYVDKILRGEASRPARRAAHHVQFDYQPENRQGNGPRRASIAARASRRGHRVAELPNLRFPPHLR